MAVASYQLPVASCAPSPPFPLPPNRTWIAKVLQQFIYLHREPFLKPAKPSKPGNLSTKLSSIFNWLAIPKRPSFQIKHAFESHFNWPHTQAESSQPRSWSKFIAIGAFFEVSFFLHSLLVVARSAVKLMPPDRAVPEPDQLEAVRVRVRWFFLCVYFRLNCCTKYFAQTQQEEERTTGTSSRACPKTEHMLMPGRNRARIRP